MGFAFINGAIARVDELGASCDRVRTKAVAAGVAVDALTKMNADLAQSHASALPGTPGFAPGEAFTPETLNRGGQRVSPAGGGA